MASSIYTIPLGTNALRQLADYIIEQHRKDPWNSAKQLVFLPNRRTARALEHMLQQHDKAILLPHIFVIGDLNEKDFTLLTGHYPSLSDKKPIPQQELLCTILQLVKQWQIANDKVSDMQSATRLAKELLAILRQFDQQGLDIREIMQTDVGNLAEHWQHNYEFLRLLCEHLPAILEQSNYITQGQYYNQLITNLLQYWQKQSPDYPMIAMLSSGHIAATRQLMHYIADHPQGMVLIPSFDVQINQKLWEAIKPSHPFYHVKTWLKGVGVTEIEQLKIWSGCSINSINHVMQQLMLPDSCTEQWHQTEINPTVFSHISYLECRDVAEEAKMLAVLIRQHVEKTPEKNLTIVTNNFTLINHLEAILQRYDIVVDNSMGVPMGKTVIGSLMLLGLELMLPALSPVAVLTLLKHPLCALGLASPMEATRLARVIELHYMRTQRCNPLDLKHMHAFFANRANEADTHCLNHQVANLIQSLIEIRQLFEPLRQQSIVEFSTLLASHQQMMEQLSLRDSEQSPSLWGSMEGEEYLRYIQELRHHSNEMPALSVREYVDIYTALFSDKLYYRPYHNCSMVQIMTPSEARLLTHQKVVIADCSDQSWPSIPKHNHWLSKSMQRDLSLLLPEHAIGHDAHIFQELLTMNEVIISRSKQVNRVDVEPSFFVQRMMALCKTPKLHEVCHQYSYLLQWAKKLDAPIQKIQITAPSPKPLYQHRPKSLSATDLEMLIKNPYGLYAKKILRLRKLEAIAPELDASDFGNIVHDLLYQYSLLHAGTKQNLYRIKEEILQQYQGIALASIFWSPKIDSIIEWFFAQDQQYRSQADKIYYEKRGEITVQDVTLNAKADRLDLRQDGVVVMDYKTGNVKVPHAKAGIVPQMLLEALMIQQGGFGNIATSSVEAIEYWQLKGGKDNKIISLYPDKNSSLDKSAIEQFATKLSDLLLWFKNEQHPYLCQPNPNIAMNERYNDTHHLSRIEEWRYNGNG